MGSHSTAEGLVEQYSVLSCVGDGSLTLATNDDTRREINEGETDFSNDRWADDGGNQWIGYERGNESEDV